LGNQFFATMVALALALVAPSIATCQQVSNHNQNICIPGIDTYATGECFGNARSLAATRERYVLLYDDGGHRFMEQALPFGRLLRPTTALVPPDDIVYINLAYNQGKTPFRDL